MLYYLSFIALVSFVIRNLIRTYGGTGWEEEIPNILKKDMKSLTAGVDSNEHQSLNLQQRVIHI